MKDYHIFVINPGSTSTKVSYHVNEVCAFSTDVFHDSSVLLRFPTINDQLDYRMAVLHDFLRDNAIDLTGLDAVVGRGGGCRPTASGIYTVNEKLLEDTKNAAGGLYHSSMLGVQMARRVHERYGGLVLMMDPPVVDELQEVARITGMKGVYRSAISHALNLRAAARHYSRECGVPYEQLRLIVCHIDGGISITAHDHGRMIDGNNAGGGEGPFTPTRMGSLAVTDGLRYLYGLKEEQIRDLCSQAGGLSSWFGTSDAEKIHALVQQGDRKAGLIWSAMSYQVSKWIGAMAAVLAGKVDAIILTGGLVRFDDLAGDIRQRCGWIAPVVCYPGEFEHEAMAAGALAVLRGEVEPKEYTGEAVWDPAAAGLE
jgi:butyrate kinase